MRRIIVEKKKGHNSSRVTDRRNFTLSINGDIRVRITFKMAAIEEIAAYQKLCSVKIADLNYLGRKSSDTFY
jgi:hypothetical protein